MPQNDNFNQKWNSAVNIIGRCTIVPVILVSLFPNVYLYLVYGFVAPIDIMLQSWFVVATVFGAFYIIEPMSYYPILGLAGTYISFTSGNISNMRVPCSATAQEVTGVKPQTPEAEIVSTLGLTGSVFTNLVMISIAALVGAQILSALPETIAKAFQTYAAPAIFGAVFGQFAINNLKVAAFALFLTIAISIIAYLTKITLLSEGWMVILLTITLTVCFARLLYMKDKKNNTNTETTE